MEVKFKNLICIRKPVLKMQKVNIVIKNEILASNILQLLHKNNMNSKYQVNKLLQVRAAIK